MTAQIVPVGLLGSYIHERLSTDLLLSDCWVEGELSNHAHAASGHHYFSLKDGEGQLRCVLFREYARRQRTPFKNGDQVTVHGSISFYQREGSTQLYVDVVQPSGVGLFALQKELTRQTLAADGLFDESRKRIIPSRPQTIGVVTSSTGAVWHDIQNVLARRYPLAKVVLSPASVQGKKAPKSLVQAIHRLERENGVHVMIIGRGGGSAEDLAAFDDEAVVRAIAGCRIPVITAIGHETDWTLADLAADLRAPTPSAAAELASPSLKDLILETQDRSLQLWDAAQQTLTHARRTLQFSARRLRRTSPRIPVALSKVGLDHHKARLRQSITQIHSDRTHQVSAWNATLTALDPQSVLRRGYAAICTPDGQPIISASQGSIGDQVRLAFHDGSRSAQLGDRLPTTNGPRE